MHFNELEVRYGKDIAFSLIAGACFELVRFPSIYHSHARMYPRLANLRFMYRHGYSIQQIAEAENISTNTVIDLVEEIFSHV